MNLNFLLAFHALQLLLKVLDSLDIVRLEERLVRHDVLRGADVVLCKLIVEGLSRDLDANAEDDLSVDDVFLQCGIQNAEMALSRLLDWVVFRFFVAHNFIQMNFVVQEVVELEPFERLEHLLDVLLEHLNQHFVLNFEHSLLHRLILLQHSLLLFF